MNKLNLISILLVLAFIGGCSTQKNYFVKFNPKDHEKISAINLSIKHNKIPSEHGPLMNCTSTLSVTKCWPIGASRNWSQEKHSYTVTDNLNAISRTLESQYPDDSIVQRIFSELSANTKHIPIKIVSAETLSNGNDTLINLYIYHKVKVSTSSYEPSTYMGVVAKMQNADGTIIYHRRVFTPEFIIPNEFSQDEYCTSFESLLQNAIQIFWTDIFGR
jgi:hypothetical protein